MEEFSEYGGVISPAALDLSIQRGMADGKARRSFSPPLNRGRFPIAFAAYNSAYWQALGYMAHWKLALDDGKEKPRRSGASGNP